MSRAVERYFPDGTRLTQPQGGFVLWVEFPASVDAQALCEQALAHGVSVAVRVVALYVTVAATEVPPGPVSRSVDVEILAAVIASLNVAVTVAPVPTPLVPPAGVTVVTVGGVVSPAGVKITSTQ